MTDSIPSDEFAVRTKGIFDPNSGEYERSVAVINDGIITQIRDDVPEDVQLRFEHDGYAIPGLVDAHSHATIRPGEGDQLGQLGADRTVAAVRATNNLWEDLRSGVTTMRLMGEEGYLDVRLAELEESDELDAPRLLPSGIHLTPTGGHALVDTPTDGEEAIRRRIRRNVQEGATHTKFFATGGVSTDTGALGRALYTDAEIAAIVDESRRQGVHIAAHAHGGSGASAAIDAGVDTIEHASLLSDEDIESLSDSDQFAVSTFAISAHEDGIRKGEADNPAVLQKLEESSEQREATWEAILDAGCNVAVGTDSMHGLLWFEIESLVEFGASAEEALAAATIDAARCIECEEAVGSVSPGKKADIVFVDADPLEELSTVSNPVGVLKDGQLVAGDTSRLVVN